MLRQVERRTALVACAQQQYARIQIIKAPEGRGFSQRLIQNAPFGYLPSPRTQRRE